MFKDRNFLKFIHWIENFVSKVLSVTLCIVILISLGDLVVVLGQTLVEEQIGYFSKTLIPTFGLFLNILIALELLENITAYLRKHIVQVELVVVTSLIAIARKIIIFDLKNSSATDLAALGFAILCLSVGYWLIRKGK